MVKIDYNMDDSIEYYAFISYKREDEKWAKWLQDKLEHYKFPTNLNGRTDLPKNIRPTFRDVTDLKPGLLAEEINNALCNSQWLIVVCSPRSAKSPWVCKEAQTFIDLGRADHIIPFVIEGTPFSGDPTTECYPDALLNLTGSRELLAANINEMGRDVAAIKVVARMFGLRFDTLWQRHEKEKRRRRNWIIATVAAFVFAILSIAGYILSLNKQLQSEKAEAIAARNVAEQERDRAENEKNRANQEKKRAEQAEDSILLTNLLLIEERNNLSKANKQVLINESKLLAELAMKKCDEGNYIEARRLALMALPQKLATPDRPFVVEAEAALRRSFEREPYIMRTFKPMSVAVSPNGDIQAKISVQGLHRTGLDIEDIKRGGKCQWTYDEGSDSPLLNGTITFNKDGSQLLIPGWRGHEFVSARTGEKKEVMQDDGWGIAQYCKDYSKILTASRKGGICVIDAKNKTIFEKNNNCNCALFDPQDNNKILVAYDHYIEAIDIFSGDSTPVFNIDDGYIESFDMHPEGKYMAVWVDDKLLIVDNKTKKMFPLKIDNFEIKEFAFNSNGYCLFVIDNDGNVGFFDTILWNKHDCRERTSIMQKDSPIRYANIIYNCDTIPHGLYYHNRIYPNVLSALKKNNRGGRKRSVVHVDGITETNYGISLVEYHYDDYNDPTYGAIFKGDTLIRVFEITGYYGASGFLNYDGKYYGVVGMLEGYQVFQTKTGKYIRTYDFKPTMYDRYAIAPAEVSDVTCTDSADICVYDINSGVEIQRFSYFPAKPEEVSIEVIDSTIYVTSEKECFGFSITPLQRLIDEAGFQFRNSGRRKMISRDFTQ